METETGWERLLENHLAFLASHRGIVTPALGGWRIESERPEFTYGIAADDEGASALSGSFRLIQLMPPCEDAEKGLLAKGYAYRRSYVYMTGRLQDRSEPRATREGLEVRRVRSAPEMEIFSEVQVRGFGTPEPVYEFWRSWLGAANLRNLGNPEQRFYVGYLDGEPAGVTLLLLRDGIAGIYAVATLPERRRKGVSAGILAHALNEARAAGCGVATLQVIEGSPAERLYRNLGFRTEFVSKFFGRD